jgi:hypothetical protein
MKKGSICLIAVILIMSFALSVYAAPGRFHKNGPPGRDDRRGGPGGYDGPRSQYMQEDARYIIQRTATVLIDAQRAVMRGHRSFGLSLAIATQSRARDLYFQRDYRDAIFHSLRARDIAFRIIRDNRGRVKPEYFPDRIEERYAHDRPRDEDLDRENERRRRGSDDDAIHLTIQFNIN